MRYELLDHELDEKYLPQRTLAIFMAVVVLMPVLFFLVCLLLAKLGIIE